MKLGLLRFFLPLLTLLAVSAADDKPQAFPGSITGELVLSQVDGRPPSKQNISELPSATPVQFYFKLQDPQKVFQLANFTYSWSMGDGEVRVGRKPYVSYNYSSSGNYTLKLEVEASFGQFLNLTGNYSMDFIVLDAIKDIEFKGPSCFLVAQNSSLSLVVGGSPPLRLCWRMLPDCTEASPTTCRLVTLQGNAVRLNYTFLQVGHYCLNLTAWNDVSTVDVSYSIDALVDLSSHLFFILPCAALILTSLIFISVTVCRPGRGKKERSRMELKPNYLPSPPPSPSKDETQPLLEGTAVTNKSYVSQV